MGQSLALLLRQMSPPVTPRDVAELPILAIGQQFQGGQNNAIGKHAIDSVFLAISEIVETHAVGRDVRKITVQNSAGDTYFISLAGDPDVRIEKVEGKMLVPTVAIEVKGGTDQSNAHNRASEAERSHVKAKAKGYPDLWTIITQKGLDMPYVRTESPTTTAWFDTAQVLARSGPDWEDFRSRISQLLGIPA